jgi:glycerophosphoryl diester phosphodiesterase
MRHRIRFFAGWNAPGQSLQIPVRHGRHDLSGERLIRDAHRQGLRVLYWTVNDPAEAALLFARGADGIITDWPDRMQDLPTSTP